MRMTCLRTAAMFFGACVLSAAPEYNSDSQLKFPENYREWVFLSSGLGMTYGPLAATSEQPAPRFDNVFVNPESYRAFMQTGRWPDKTTFILEIRSSEGRASINKGGHFQTGILGIEAEVKDEVKGKAKWTFYGFPFSEGKVTGSGKAHPESASCYECHAKNTAVDNTFVQFYPQLWEVAVRKGSVKPGFER